MNVNQPATSSFPNTHSEAEFHYFVCDAIPATAEMKSNARARRTDKSKDCGDSPNRGDDERRNDGGSTDETGSIQQ